MATTEENLPLLADGDYQVEVMESGRDRTCFGLIEYIQFTFRVIHGPCSGQTIASRIALRHYDEERQNWHRAKLSALSNATGVHRPSDTSQFHNIPFIVRMRRGRIVDFRRLKDG